MNHVMIDLETLGTDEDSVFISIAALKFDYPVGRGGGPATPASVGHAVVGYPVLLHRGTAYQLRARFEETVLQLI